MTKAGKLEREFELFKKEVLERLTALEAATATAAVAAPKEKVLKSTKKIVIEAKDDIVAKDAD